MANDITFQSGSFGPLEDAMFRAATELALAEKLPLIYLAANSGARVGLASEVKECLQVQWAEEADPSRGISYLYLSDADHRRLTATAAGSPHPAVEAQAGCPSVEAVMSCLLNGGVAFHAHLSHLTAVTLPQPAPPSHPPSAWAAFPL